MNAMDIDYRKIGRRLRTAREHHQMTQAQVAEILGIAENSYSNMERGQQKISLRRVIELCTLFKIKPGTVLDDCCDELIAQEDITLDENVEKQELFRILEKCTDKEYLRRSGKMRSDYRFSTSAIFRQILNIRFRVLGEHFFAI